MPAESGVDEPETYDGPLQIGYDDATVTVEAHLAGFFQPIDGTFRWHGRLQPDESLTALAATAGRKRVRAAVPGGEPVAAHLGEATPWGGYRITGRGRPPFAGA